MVLGVEQVSTNMAYGLNTFRFVGVPGQRLYYDALVGAGEAGQTTMWMVAPSGAVVLGDVGGRPQSADKDAGPVTLTESGDYYLMISNAGGVPARCRFRILDAGGASGMPVSFGQKVGGSGPDSSETLAPYAAKLYRFEGEVGQEVYLDSLNAGARGATWTLVEADDAGRVMPLESDGLAVLRTVGTRVLALNSTSAVAVPYGFRLLDRVDTTVPMPEHGVTVSGDAVFPGSEVGFMFQAVAGERFYFDGVGASSGEIQVRIIGPSGETVLPARSCAADYGPFAAAEAGEHLLVVKNTGNELGTYAFRFLRVSEAAVLVPGGRVEGLTEARQVRLYQFEAGTGGSWVARGVTVPADLVWAWYDKTDVVVAGELPMTVDLGPVQTVVGASYLLVLRDLGDVLEEDYRFDLSSGNHAPLLGEARAEVVELTPLDFRIPATDSDVGDVLRFTLGEGTPDGLVLDRDTGVVTWVPSEAQGPGEYTIGVTVSDNGQPSMSASRAYMIRVLEAPLPPALGAIADRVVTAGLPLQLTLMGTDPDLPLQTLHYSLISGPAGMTVDPASGALKYTTSVSDPGMSRQVEVAVQDSGAAPLEARRSFGLTVVPLDAPAVGVEVQGQSATLRWTSTIGVRYRVQHCPSLLDAVWVNLGGDLVAKRTTTTVTDTIPVGTTVRFYRVLAVD
jgi:hypothetical protein